MNKKKKVCRMCDGKEFSKVLDMGCNALVNSLTEEKDLNETELTYPLKVVRCDKCSLVQVEKPIDPHKIYKEVDYLYFSSDMPGLSKYFKEYATEVAERFLKFGDFVLEIGSNDGIMLEHFANMDNMDFRVLGVDPATNVVLRALARGVPTVPLFFEERLAKMIAKELGQAKVVYGNNCIAHIDDLDSVMEGVKGVTTDDGVFIVECNYWGGMVKNKNYSLVYHDHFSYFSLKNWVDYAPKFGFEVFDAEVTPAQGGSLRVFMQKGKPQLTTRCANLQMEEEELGINTLAVAKRYGKECVEEAEKLRVVVERIKEEGKVIAGYGAAAKGFSVLKLAQINEKHIDYFVDDSPAKQGKYTPVAHIPVISRDEAEAKLPDYFFITAPNYAQIIMEKEKEKGYKGKFILCDSTVIE